MDKEKIKESQEQIKALLKNIGKAETEIKKGIDIKTNKQRIITFEMSVLVERKLISEYRKKLSPK